MNTDSQLGTFLNPRDFSPIVHFHTNELFFPCSYDYWAANKEHDTAAAAYEGFTECLNDAPMYWQCVENDLHYFIQYVFFYAASGDLGILGHHYSHVPHTSNVIVVIDKHTMAVVGAHLSGEWVERKDLALDKGHIHVYVAYLNHRNYPEHGVWTYGICCLADYTSPDGREWNPKEFTQFSSQFSSQFSPVKIEDLRAT